MFIAAAAVGSVTFGFGVWVPGIIFSFIYNKMYIKELMEKGYRPADSSSRSALESAKIIASDTKEIEM